MADCVAMFDGWIADGEIGSPEYKRAREISKASFVRTCSPNMFAKASSNMVAIRAKFPTMSADELVAKFGGLNSAYAAAKGKPKAKGKAERLADITAAVRRAIGDDCTPDEIAQAVAAATK